MEKVERGRFQNSELVKSVGGINLVKHHLIQKVKNFGSGEKSHSCSLLSEFCLMCIKFLCSTVCFLLLENCFMCVDFFFLFHCLCLLLFGKVFNMYGTFMFHCLCFLLLENCLMNVDFFFHCLCLLLWENCLICVKFLCSTVYASCCWKIV